MSARRVIGSRRFLAALGVLAGAVSVTACMGGSTGAAGGSAPVYYVSPSGNNAAAGTSPATAWRTLSKVSSTVLPAGSKVLLQGGQRFDGSLILGSWDKGTATAPVVIGSYGTGRAAIFTAVGNGISVLDSGGVTIQNLNLTGGAGPRIGDGINAYNNLAAGHRLDHVDINDVDVTGFLDGISIGGKNAAAGFDGVQVTDSKVDGNIDDGLITFGPAFNATAPTYANQDVLISGVTASGNLGNPLDKYGNTGSGILLGSVSDGTITRSVSAGNGGRGAAVQGPEGIWAYDSTKIDIEHDLSFDERTSNGVDGDGFGFDQNTSDSIMQDNLSYNNAGAGFLLYSSLNNDAQHGDIVRDNISSNDVRDGYPFYSGLCVVGFVSNAEVYQNTVVMEPAGSGQSPVLRLGPALKDITIRNNIFSTTSGPIVATTAPLSSSSVELQGNDYYSEDGPWQVIWGNTVYGSLSAWQAGAAEEMTNGQPTGLAVAPQLAGPVFDLSVDSPGSATGTQGFKLKADSPLIGAGLNLASLGMTPAPANYLGQAQSVQHPDVGAL